MNNVSPARLWAFTVLGLTQMVVVLSALSIDGPVRTLTVLIWVTVCPGIAFANRLVKLDGLALVVLGVTLSFAMAELVAAGLMYLHVYSWQGVFGALVAVTLGCIVPDLRPRSGTTAGEHPGV